MSACDSEHVPTFTEGHQHGLNGQRSDATGLYCSCGWVWGMGNPLGAERAWDNHALAEMGVSRMHT